MENNRIIERFGGVTKEEPLTTLDKDLVLTGTQVMESPRPFFYYYNDRPEMDMDAYLYFVLDGYHGFETILRATAKVQKKVNCPFDAAAGSTSMNTRTCQVIRIKQLKKYCQVPHIQKLYQDEGIRFKKQFASFKEQPVMICLQKFMYLIPYDSGIYLDTTQANVGYFRVPDFIPWEDFRGLTAKAKYDTDLLFFDAATAYLYENKQIVNLIRIYKEGMSPEKINPIRERYLKLISEQ
ncbi:MAG: hypothetical protein V2I46_04560 [Bacteroides sp.]|jgi:hypothetical protein|nr:hypothetical protein [Bacteroides sp.]